jgi:DNA helicase-2/ATP-dependent DNA helicase PcrA
MDFLEGLNPQQQEAVAHTEGPLLLLAGAGSGKTRVITHRIGRLISELHIPGPCVLAVTFTNKAADEMRTRVNTLISATAARTSPLVSTFHSFCVRLLRRDGESLSEARPGFTRQFLIYDDDDQIALLKSIYRKLGIDDKFMQYRAMLSRISHAKSHKETPLDWYKNANDPRLTRMAKVYEQYEEQLQQANALDFDDLLLESVRLLKNDEALRTRHNRLFEFVMIDEYQDTNRSQYELMLLLTNKRKNICVVGDEDQSIYGWRGADIRNILDFERDFPNAKVIRLEQNYRSTKNILEAASAVVANNKERKGKWLWTSSAAGARIGSYEAPDGENEALFIADTIEKVLSARPDERVAVLYRTNSQSRPIEEALRRYGRKYLVIGGFSFYQRAEVKDVLSYLKVSIAPSDSLGLLRVINTPARGIGRSTIDQVEQFALDKNLSLWSAIERMLAEKVFPPRAESALKSFVRLIDELRVISRSEPVPNVLRAILEKTGYEEVLKADDSPEAESRLGNIEELVNAAVEAAERGESVSDFLDHAALVSDADQVDERAPVSLLTIHNAKGLEFSTVFISGMEENLFPHSRSLGSDAAMEEERRLCYVGMTRAEKRLYLTWARYRRRFGGGQPEATLKSRFLAEVPASLCERLSPYREMDIDEVDMFSEQDDVRESMKRNLYTGRTYNSLEKIAQFFAERGMPVPAGIARSQQAPPRPSHTPNSSPSGNSSSAPDPPMFSSKPTHLGSSPASGRTSGASSPQKFTQRQPVRKPLGPRSTGGMRAGVTIRHPKYGRGTVLRREGEGEDAKLTISFPGVGLKKIVEKYADLKIEE